MTNQDQKKPDACQIAQDLMPSVLDGIASEASQKLVANHLKECPDCRKIYENMQKPEPETDIDIDTLPEKSYLKTIKKRQTRNILLVCLAALVIIAGITVYAWKNQGGSGKINQPNPASFETWTAFDKAGDLTINIAPANSDIEIARYDSHQEGNSLYIDIYTRSASESGEIPSAAVVLEPEVTEIFINNDILLNNGTWIMPAAYEVLDLSDQELSLKTVTQMASIFQVSYSSVALAYTDENNDSHILASSAHDTAKSSDLSDISKANTVIFTISNALNAIDFHTYSVAYLFGLDMNSCALMLLALYPQLDEIIFTYENTLTDEKETASLNRTGFALDLAKLSSQGLSAETINDALYNICYSKTFEYLR